MFWNYDWDQHFVQVNDNSIDLEIREKIIVCDQKIEMPGFP